jgi:hypothetical protein
MVTLHDQVMFTRRRVLKIVAILIRVYTADLIKGFLRVSKEKRSNIRARGI